MRVMMPARRLVIMMVKGIWRGWGRADRRRRCVEMDRVTVLELADAAERLAYSRGR